MKRMKRQIWLHVVGIAFLILPGCAPKVMVPPRINLKAYDNVGMIEFSSNTEGRLLQFVTLKFLQSIQSAQPGVRILELGDEERVLKLVQRDRLDLGAIQAIGKKYNVDAVITGHLNVTGVKPKVRLSTLLESMSVHANVEALLSAKLLETAGGATIWTSSARGKETVAHVTLISNGPAYFDASDPEHAYGKLVQGLVKKITKDFRIRYIRK